VMDKKLMMTSPFRATELGDEAIIVSIDKDFMQVPTWHYNFVKKVKKYVTPEEGLRFFYKQILTGRRCRQHQGYSSCGGCSCNKDACRCEDRTRVVSVLCGGDGGRTGVREC
jgi:hypothetical protein